MIPFKTTTLHVCTASDPWRAHKQGGMCCLLNEFFLCAEVELLLRKRGWRGVLSSSDTDLADLTGGKVVKTGHRSQVTGAGQWGEGLSRQEVAHYGEWMWACVEAQGAPEGGPQEITFRFSLTKDTHAKPNSLQCSPSLTALRRKRPKLRRL